MGTKARIQKVWFVPGFRERGPVTGTSGSGQSPLSDAPSEGFSTFTYSTCSTSMLAAAMDADPGPERALQRIRKLSSPRSGRTTTCAASASFRAQLSRTVSACADGGAVFGWILLLAESAHHRVAPSA